MKLKSQTLREEAERLRREASKLDSLAKTEERNERSNIPLLERMVFAATARCPCGAGLAYDPENEEVLEGHGYWDCSAIILGTADEKVKHEAQLPFVFWEIKSENQPSAYGVTTRPEKTS